MAIGGSYIYALIMNIHDRFLTSMYLELELVALPSGLEFAISFTTYNHRYLYNTTSRIEVRLFSSVHGWYTNSADNMRSCIT